MAKNAADFIFERLFTAASDLQSVLYAFGAGPLQSVVMVPPETMRALDQAAERFGLPERRPGWDLSLGGLCFRAKPEDAA